MPSLKEKGIALLGTTASVDMKTAASTTLFTVPVGKVARITHVVVRDASASLAGGTSYSFTQWVQTITLANLITANTGYVVILPFPTSSNIYTVTGTPPQFTELAAGTNFQITVTTGSTLAATATIDVFGYLT